MTKLEYQKQWRAKNPDWYSYAGMMSRCHNKKCSRYKDYGGKGIRVCARWKGSYINFRHDMAPRPEGYTIDRIGPKQGYSPENCRWASRRLQGENRRKVNQGQLLLALD